MNILEKDIAVSHRYRVLKPSEQTNRFVLSNLCSSTFKVPHPKMDALSRPSKPDA